VLVHSSTVPEPFGQVVVEGMAAGLPVVAAAAGGPLEIVRDGVDGLLYRPGDVEALAAALRRLATDEALRRRLGDAGRANAQRFRPTVAAEQVSGVSRDVVARRRRDGRSQ
jgi:glycosyltransferase involved in cell wall biosynthesis